PYLIQVVDEPHAAVQLSQWLSDRNHEKVIHTLNIAGPRNSEAPELYDQAKALLETALPFLWRSQCGEANEAMEPGNPQQIQFGTKHAVA
ncbi:MAG: YpsA SLOG family protein, partial [Methylocella sp.]